MCMVLTLAYYAIQRFAVLMNTNVQTNSPFFSPLNDQALPIVRTVMKTTFRVASLNFLTHAWNLFGIGLQEDKQSHSKSVCTLQDLKSWGLIRNKKIS